MIEENTGSMPSGSGTCLWAAEYMKWDDVVVSSRAALGQLYVFVQPLSRKTGGADAAVAVPVSVSHTRTRRTKSFLKGVKEGRT